jgi:hypothetical protein
MNLENLLVIGLLFVFAIFLIPNIETAIVSISGSETLKPLFDWWPIAFIGVMFFTIYMVGFRS